MKILLPLLTALAFAVHVETHADVILTEFMASNSKTLADEDGSFEDWIEIQNTSTTNVSLLNWSLTDNPSKLTKWSFPDTNLPPGNFMVVFASNKDRRAPGAPLHTNFKLAAAGGYLALVKPDGATKATEFAPAYPSQMPDVSYGFGLITLNTTLQPTGALARILVPSAANGGSALDYAWTGAINNEPFNTTAWLSGPLGAGFTAGDPLVGPDAMMVRFNFDAAPVANSITDSKPSGTLHNGVNSGSAWMDSSIDTSPSPMTRNGVMQFTSANTNQITLAANSDFNSTTGTISFWVRSPGAIGSGNEGAMIFDRRSNTTGDVIVLQDNGTIFVQARNSGGHVNSFASTSAIADDRWHHVAYVYDQGSAGSIAIYIDGLLSASLANSAAWAWPASQQIELGYSHDPYWKGFDGFMDDVRIYNQMLSPADIAQIAAGDVPVNPADIGTNLQAPMFTTNASAFIRVPFVVGNPADLSQLTLKLKYDDGFVAWINGVEVARANAPTNVAWNSTATATHSSVDAESFVIGSPDIFLVPGTNILAIQGLNVSDKNPTFLISTELTGVTIAAWSTNGMYFTSPTPSALNIGGANAPGPIIQDARHTPNIPLDGDDLRITARIIPTTYAVSSVLMTYRVMFGSEVATPMNDGGTNGDLVAGDGVWSALIPASASSLGQMVRYYISATDTHTNASRWPLYTDPANSAQYLGTVIQPGYVTSKLPVVHLFAPANVLQPGAGVGGSTSQTGADSQTGGRISAYFDGEFYDNIYMALRGNSTAGFYKKSHRMEFNSEHKFRYSDSAKRIAKTSFEANYPDPAYMRQGLSFWLNDQLGVPAPFILPMRLQLNGSFYQLADQSDVQGEEMLTRFGYDPNGAYYANVGTVVASAFSTGGFEKKTRKTEGNADYTALANAIVESLPTGQRATNIFDKLDLPEVINYMVAARFTHQNDDVWANMALYHDNDGDDLWRVMPYDQNLSWGAAYVDSAALEGIQATNDTVKSHPLYGSSQTPYGNWNRMYDAIFQVPQTREMFLRRMRTVLDTYVKPSGTPTNQLPIESKALAWRDLVTQEAGIDRAWWGWPPDGGQCNFTPGIDLANGVYALLSDFLEKRRQHFYGKHCITNASAAFPVGITKTNCAGIPLAQPTNAVVSIVAWDYNPVSGNQDEEYIRISNTNTYAVDLSGWVLDGGIHLKFAGGTVMPANSSLYVSPNTRAFRARAASPHGGQGLFVIGPCSGHLNAWGETLTITDDSGRLVCSNNIIGTPSLAQQFLRVTEIMYNPSSAATITNDAQLFEYIELRNTSASTTLDLAGCRFTNGVLFNFTGSAVTTLSPGQRVLVVRSLAAFTARYGGGALIAGEFAGTLDNNGETLRLEDATGEKILEFAYNNAWYRATDGLGFSLVIVNDAAPWATWGAKSSWRASGVLGGSPGASDNAANIAPILINEVLAHTDLPEVDAIELYNPASTNVNIGGWFLTDDIATPKKYRIPNGAVIPANGYALFNASQFGSAFLLSEYGEFVWLLSGDSSTNFTGYVVGQDFPESPNGVSFGRYSNSQTNVDFVLQSAQTLGAANAYPRVGPVVISEIMYHPPDLADGSDDSLDEFIELQNITGTSVPLYCTFTSEAGYGLAALTNTWRFRNAVDFDFPTNTALAAGSRLLVVGFDPANATQLAAFRTLYSVPTNVPIFGPWQGKLDNSADTIELKYPDKPDVTTNVFVPYVMVDKVAYHDTAPWATNADGFGHSLQRVLPAGYGNDPTNWAAVGITAGTANSLNALPTVVITAPAAGAAFYRTPPIALSATATDSDGTVAAVEFWDGSTQLAMVTVPPYNWYWTNAPVGAHALTVKAVDNLGGTRASLPVSFTVVSQPPTVVLTSPTNGATVQSGTVVTLAATPTDIDSAIVGVDFYADGILLDTDATAPYTWTWTATSSTFHTLSAIARDESSSSVASAATITVTPLPGQFSDLFALRGTINGSTNFVSGNNSTYTSEPNEPTPATPASSTAHSAWLCWVAPATGTCTMDTLGSSFDSVLYVYTNNPASPQALTNLVFVAGNDDTGTGSQSKVSFSAVAGQAYQIAVYGYAVGDGGSISFHVNLQAPPLITTQPQGQSVSPGANVTFTAVAAGTAPLSYRWRFNGTNITGATTNFYTILNVQTTNAGNYTVIVTNKLGSVTSSVAPLTVSATPVAPLISTQPQSQTAIVGSNVTFSVTANGSTPLAYQWRTNGINITGAMSSSLNLTGVQFSQAGDYTVVVTNSLGSVTSSIATLTVTLPPVTTVVFETNSVWRYLDNGVDQGTNWIAPAFADGTWAIAPGKFGFYGNASSNTIVTPLSYGPNGNSKYLTYYFRKQFVVSSLAGITNLSIQVLRDDGVALYINGIDCYRNNLPAGTLSYTNLASNCSDQGLVYQSASLPVNGLVIGTNIIAAEIHQSAANSSDAAFDMRLTMTAAQVPPVIITQPQDQTIAVGANVTFSASADGTGPLAYQWRFNGTNLAGATATNYTIPGVQLNNVGNYTVVITNMAGSATSTTATLAVINPDSDSDGMPDAWEQAHGLIVGVNDANLDPDGDGMNNLKEYLSHTDPQNPSSVLKLTPALGSGGGILLRFTAQADLGYTVLNLDGLAGTNWQSWMQVNSAPSNRLITLTNTAPLVPKRFFRVVTPQIP